MTIIFVLLLIILTYYMGTNYDFYIIMHLNKEFKQFVLLDSICFIMDLYMNAYHNYVLIIVKQ